MRAVGTCTSYNDVEIVAFTGGSDTAKSKTAPRFWMDMRISVVIVGYIWPTWLLLPYIIIVWRISKDFLESGRVSFQTNFPLFIGRRRSSSAKHHQSADWIVAIEVPPSEQNRQLNFNNDDKIYLVTKAIPKVYSDGSRKQLIA